MTGRLTKERITKDARYQESREVTLEWWDYNLHSRVTSFFGGTVQFAQNKSHTQEATRVLIKFQTHSYRLKPVDLLDGFLHFMCGFLAALDLSAVRLYGDDWSITPSASNRLCPHFQASRRTKATMKSKANPLGF